MNVAATVADRQMHTASPSTAGAAHLAPDFATLQDAPSWFQQRAAAAWEEFQSLPMPGANHEAWRYSGAKRLALESLHPASEPTAEETAQAVARSTGMADAAAKLVFVNDRLVHASTEGLADGIQCLPFSDALRSHGDVLEQYLMKREAELGSEKFAALHLAHVRAGAVILAPKNAVQERPIEIFHWVTGSSSLVFPHTLIVTGEQARVTVLDHHGSLRDEPAQSIAVADFVAGRGSRITYANCQEMSMQARALHISSTTVGRDASVKALQLHLGGAFSRSESVSDLIGEGARSEMLGVSLPIGDQLADFRTLQHHTAPRAYSDLLYKNALYDKSRTVFAGLIRVDHGAHYTDAYQKCRNLLNSEDAEAASLPGLEINADQVKCSHGATSAPVSKEEIFYLSARGIPEDQARKLIVLGFVEDVMSQLGDEALAAELNRRLEDKFAAVAG